MNYVSRVPFHELSQEKAQKIIQEITGRCRTESEVKRDLEEAGFNILTASVVMKGPKNNARANVLIMGPDGSMIAG